MSLRYDSFVHLMPETPVGMMEQVQASESAYSVPHHRGPKICERPGERHEFETFEQMAPLIGCTSNYLSAIADTGRAVNGWTISRARVGNASSPRQSITQPNSLPFDH